MYDSRIYRRCDIFCLFIISLSISQSVGQFPRECATETNLLVEKRCCPVNELTGLACGGPGRGECRYIDNHTIAEHCSGSSDIYPYYNEDERVCWPYKFFQEWCVCEWPFQGPSCNECVWGYYGAECDTARVLVRRNVIKPENRQIMLDTVKYMDWMKYNVSEDYVIATCSIDEMEASQTVCYKNTTYYDYIVWVHFYSATLYTYGSKIDLIHTSSVFPSWHRYFMLLWERIVQKVSGDDHYALPYYKWIGDESCSICVEDMFGKPSGKFGYLTDNSPFHKWDSICDGTDIEYMSDGKRCDTDVKYGKIFRFPGQGSVNNFPGVGQLEALLTWPLYDSPPYSPTSTYSFRNMFYGFASPTDGYTIGEHLHRAGHTMFNGTLSPHSTSLNDPLFFVFHCYVDMVLEMWVQHWGGQPAYDAYPIYGALPQNNRYDYMVTFFPPVTVDSMLTNHSSQLGYVYEDM